MNVEEAIKIRRAYRSLDPVEISEELIKDLAEKAKLAPSCFNKQPWRFVFVYDTQILKKLHTAIAEGNRWITEASMIIAVFSRKDLDCMIKDRIYYLFDTGMAVGFMLLRATEMGLVAHPIAGYDEGKAKEILNIPEEMKVITLIGAGKKSEKPSSLLDEKQLKLEKERPPRLKLREFVFFNRYF